MAMRGFICASALVGTVSASPPFSVTGGSFDKTQSFDLAFTGTNLGPCDWIAITDVWAPGDWGNWGPEISLSFLCLHTFHEHFLNTSGRGFRHYQYLSHGQACALTTHDGPVSPVPFPVLNRDGTYEARLYVGGAVKARAFVNFYDPITLTESQIIIDSQAPQITFGTPPNLALLYKNANKATTLRGSHLVLEQNLGIGTKDAVPKARLTVVGGADQRIPISTSCLQLVCF